MSSEGRRSKPGASTADAVLGPLVQTLTYGAARTHSIVSRRLEWLRQFTEGLSEQALSDREQAALASQLYGRRKQYGGEGLNPWEEAWFEQALPAAPAKLLLGGCGSGREVSGLLARGYQVFGCEPAPGLYATARNRFAGVATFGQLSYEHWADGGSSLSVVSALAALEQAAPFDAVLLGWGSLSHVLDAGVRRRLFQRLDALCPHGPILASVSVETEWRSTVSRPRQRGQRLGRWVDRLRGGESEGEGVTARHGGERLMPHVGIVHCFTSKELEELARDSGRSLVCQEIGAGSRRCTFNPRADCP